LGKADGVAEDFFQSRFKLAANIGTQLIEIGVKAVIVAGWAVDDAAALSFAREFYECMFEGSTFGMAVKSARETTYNNYRSKNTWGAYQCYGDPHYNLHKDSRAAGKRQYIISAQAEIDLSNLLSDLKTGDTTVTYASEKLNEISSEVDKQGIRVPAITELEAMILKEAGDYKRATTKFEQLLASEDSSYSFTAIEQYCNIKAKHLITLMDDAAKRKSSLDLNEEFKRTMSDLDALLQLSPTAERYNLKASAYKRSIRLYKRADAPSIRKALGEAALNYYRAYEKATKEKKWYPLTNWVAIETILILADRRDRSKKDKRGWGRPVIGEHRLKVYDLPTLEEIAESLDRLESFYSKRPVEDQYWDRVVIPNIRLCAWILSSTDKTLKKRPDARRVKDSYLKVWKLAGSRNEKQIEVQHLDLLIEAVTILAPGNSLLPGLKEVREKLNAAVGS
jgi:hypothetical protein